MSKGKGKRRYTMSAKARAQRRVAAWKTGERAATTMGQVIPPCKRSLCPMNDPNEQGNCSVKRQVEATGGALERCIVQLAINPELKAKYVAAIERGDFAGLSEFIGTLMAGMGELSVQELGRIVAEGGFAIATESFGPKGEPISGVKQNPRAEPWLKLLEMLGATAAQQAITPKAAGERKRDEGLTSVLEMYKRRAAIAGASAGAP